MQQNSFKIKAILIEVSVVSAKQQYVKLVTETGHWIDALVFIPSNKKNSPLAPLFLGSALEGHFYFPKYPHFPLQLKEWHFENPYELTTRQYHYLTSDWFLFTQRFLSQVLIQIPYQDLKEYQTQDSKIDGSFLLLKKLNTLFFLWSAQQPLSQGFNKEHLYYLKTLFLCKFALVLGLSDLSSWEKQLQQLAQREDKFERWLKALEHLVPVRFDSLCSQLMVHSFSSDDSFDLWLWCQLGLKEKSYQQLENVVFSKKSPTIEFTDNKLRSDLWPRKQQRK